MNDQSPCGPAASKYTTATTFGYALRKSDTVFGVKASLICHFTPHAPDEPGAPAGYDGQWYTLEHDFVLTDATA